jgi:rhodanese-related sulfurtransferase
MKIRFVSGWLATLACIALLAASGCSSKKEASAAEPTTATEQQAAEESGSPEPGTPEPGKVDGETARQLVEDGAVLLDVRTPGEYQSGHIDGAVNIPIQAFGQRKDELKELGEPLVVYCRSGNRSAHATNALEDMGVEKVYDLGGIGSW